MDIISAQTYGTIDGELLKFEIRLSFPIMIDYTSLHGILIFTYMITRRYGTLICDLKKPVDIKFSAQDTFLEYPS